MFLHCTVTVFPTGQHQDGVALAKPFQVSFQVTRPGNVRKEMVEHCGHGVRTKGRVSPPVEFATGVTGDTDIGVLFDVVLCTVRPSDVNFDGGLPIL